MPTIAPGSSQTINLTADQAVQVSTTGLAYVDLVSGAPGSPYDSRRVNVGVPQTFGPYGVAASIRVRAVDGALTHDAALLPSLTAQEVGQFRGLVSDAWKAAPVPRVSEAAAPPATMTSLHDGPLWIEPGSALDMSAKRGTAVPAGSRGRIVVSGDRLLEGGSPVRFHVATIQPETVFTPIPGDRETVDAAVASLARRGINCLRLMGLEHFVMAGQDGVAVFDPARVDALDYFLAALKREGIYWVISTMSYNGFEDLDGAAQRFVYTESTNVKMRIYTEQAVRDNYALGITRLWNRVNPHTGLNILQDPALLMVEPFNEQSTTFCAQVQWPSRWLTRTAGATAAAQTWGEWLQDTSKAHGYADLTALNAAWGTGFASYALAAADANPAMTNAISGTRKQLNLIQYMQYLEDHLGAWYLALYRGLGYAGILSWHTMYPSHLETRGVQVLPVSDVANWHSYVAIQGDMNVGTQSKQPDNPIWENERPAFLAALCCGQKPFWLGEAGWPSIFRFRHQFPLTIAASASQGAVASAWFSQGDFFAAQYLNDTSTHGARTRILDSWVTPAAHVNSMIDVMHTMLLLRGDVSEMTVTQRLGVNERTYGVNRDGSFPLTASRAGRAFSTMYQPAALGVALSKMRLDWTTDNTVDDVANATLKSWLTVLQDAQAAGAIAADHPSLVSALANNGAILSVATTGTVGGLTATTADPVLDIGSNTLVTGDRIFITNLTGTGGTWPGTNNRNTLCYVTKGTGNYVQLSANTRFNCGGLPLTGLSGANFTAGTWCEAANVLESGHREWGMSRRLKRCFARAPYAAPRTVYYGGAAGVSLPETVGPVTVQALTDDCSVYVTSHDDLPITSSARMLLGMVGQALNTGTTYTTAADGKITITATGTYPIQQVDARATLTLTVSKPDQWKLYRLARNGRRIGLETLAGVDVMAGTITVKLATGVNQPACDWELVRE